MCFFCLSPFSHDSHTVTSAFCFVLLFLNFSLRSHLTLDSVVNNNRWIDIVCETMKWFRIKYIIYWRQPVCFALIQIGWMATNEYRTVLLLLLLFCYGIQKALKNGQGINSNPNPGIAAYRINTTIEFFFFFIQYNECLEWERYWNGILVFFLEFFEFIETIWNWNLDSIYFIVERCPNLSLLAKLEL